MKQPIILSLVFFVAGVGLTTLILANPLGWSWAETIQAGLSTTATRDPDSGVRTGTTPPAAASSNAERRILYWRAPMDPTYIRDQPGKSPMGMDLVPVYPDKADSAPGVVRIDPGFVQNIGVRSVEVTRTDIPHTIRTVGTFTYDDSQIVSINTKYEGWIENVQVNYVGEEVQNGQRLFDIFSPELVNTQHEYMAAVGYLERIRGSSYPDVVERARSLAESARQRLRYWDVPDSQIDALLERGEPRRTLTVISPVEGIVLSKMDQGLEGMLARPGMNLYKIVDLSSIWIEAEIYERDIPWLQVGQRARISVPHMADRPMTGTVRYIYPFVNRTTRTLKLSIELPNPGRQLRANMYADVIFDASAARGVLAVPEEAVIRSGQRNVVVLDMGSGTFQVREVSLGRNGNGLWEVRDGLGEGSRVVVSAQFLIDSESNLREAIRKLTSGSAANAVEGTEASGMDPGMDMDHDMKMKDVPNSDNQD